MNQTYEDVDSQPRPVSYIHPFAIRKDCVDEENYETLTEIQTQFNIYECPPIIEEAKEHPKSKPNVSDIKKDDTWHCEGTEITKIKQDLRKTKVSVIILASFVVVFLIISLIAVALAVILPLHNTTENQSLMAGPQAILAPNKLSGQGINDSTLQIIVNLSSEFDILRDIVNASAWKLTSELSKLMNQTRGNHSNSLSELEDLRNDLTSQADQLHRLIQQMSNRSNATSLANQVISLQNQSQMVQSKIMLAENNITGLVLTQSNLQKNLNVTQSNLNQVNHQIGSLQNQLSATQNQLESVDERATAVEDQLTTIQTIVNTLTTQVNNLGQQLNLTQSNVTLVSSQTANLQVSLNNHLSSPIELYQNCYQDTTSCSVSELAYNNRLIVCSTPPLNATITVGQ